MITLVLWAFGAEKTFAVFTGFVLFALIFLVCEATATILHVLGRIESRLEEPSDREPSRNHDP